MSQRIWCCLVILSSLHVTTTFLPGWSQGTKETKQPKEITNSIGMKLVRIPAGTFTMGSPEEEKDRQGHEGPQHEVKITKPFYLGVYEVTQGQFKKVLGYNPSYYSTKGKGRSGVKYALWPGDGNRQVTGLDTTDFPVENVSWVEAVELCEKLSAVPEEKKKGMKYRLPSEAEWEYACRGGAPSYQVFHFGNSLSSTQANFGGEEPYGAAAKGPFLNRTCKVGSYKPNRFGLYDMHGNVGEWCSDRYAKDYYQSSPKEDPQGPAEGKLRVFRGGWESSPGHCCRSAYRNKLGPSGPRSSVGFRVAAVPVE
jgi:formylglycine-generating enzyme required for sulfatase activity